MEEKLQQLEEKGLIARVDQPTDWISNLTAVWKADKKQVRVCLDPQESVKRNYYNMPTLDDVLPMCSHKQKYSVCWMPKMRPLKSNSVNGVATIRSFGVRTLGTDG